MKREMALDILNFLVALTVFVLPVYFAYLEYPFWIQILPSVLLVVPIVVALYKKRLETEIIEKQKIIEKTQKLRPLLVKLERLRPISSIGISLTHYGNRFIEKEIAFLGWRKHFNRQGKYLDSEFGWFDYHLYGSAKVSSNREEFGFSDKLTEFYWLVSGFLHLYDDLVAMIKLAGQIPTEEMKNIQELEANYEDFVEALKDLCDKDEEIGKVFRGRYPLKKSHEKLT